MIRSLSCCVVLSATGLLSSAAAPRTVWVDACDLSHATCGFGRSVRARQSVTGTPLAVAGRTWAQGFGTCPESAVGFVANGGVKAFRALVGIDDAAESGGANRRGWVPTARFSVWADGKVVWRSGDVKIGQRPKPVRVDLSGAREIVLETSAGACWTAFDKAHADWLDAAFELEPDATLEPIADRTLTAQLGILTPPEKPSPQFNGADIWGVRPGHPVLFRVPCSGERPIRFSATGLPAGVTLDPAKGVLGGVAPEKPGDYDIVVTAENAKGRATRTVRLAVGDTICLTPPMGWNSWNAWCYRLTAERAKEAARAMEASGLGDHGWAYVNLDDWWQMNNTGCERVEMRRKDLGREDVIGPARDADGRIIPNRAFPDMKGLADYIHSFGFKAGLYSSPGPLTCGKCEGSYGHELQDAGSWADWGFDYVKYDWCSYSEVFRKESGGVGGWSDASGWTRADIRDLYVKPYRLMNECLRRQNRDIVFSYCQYGIAHVEDWGRANGANCWRSWDDLKDTWTWLCLALESRIEGEYWRHSGPGCWADPDMMIVGRQYSHGYDHPSFLTPNEQYTHVSLWCMIGAPLLTGCDLSRLDAFTRSLLVNDEVIAVSQDRLGKVARRVRKTDAEDVWMRPLADGSTAVALVNRYPYAREISVSFDALGLGDRRWVKDLWRQRCEGLHYGSYSALVPPHATKLVKMRETECPKCD